MNIRIRRAIFPFLILGGTVAVVAYMMANPITPERLDVGERQIPVEIMEIRHTREEVVVAAQGTVTAARQVQVRPEVAGRIVGLSSALVPGGRFAAGQTLVTIDERDYRVQLAVRQEGVAGARLALRQEQARQALAEEEWRLLEDSVATGDANRELVLRIPWIEQAEAAVVAAESALTKAELDLDRCTLTAPFNAIVIREQVDVGQLVGPQTEVATLAGTDAYWVQVSLPVAHLAWIEIPGGDRRGAAASGSPATVVQTAGAVEIRRQGRVERLLGDVDPDGRMARLLIVIDDPLNLSGRHGDSDLPLLLGSYVTVEIRGRTIDDAVSIPRRALREVHADGDGGAREGLWIVDADDRLAIREAEVIWRTQETVIVANAIADGERLIISTLATPIEGMKLAIAAVETAADRAVVPERPKG